MNIYDHIASNNRRTWLLIFLFPLMISLLVVAACVIAMFIINDPQFAIDGLGIWKSFLYNHQNLLSTTNQLFFWGGVGYASMALPVVFAIALGWMGISYLFGDKMMLGFAGAEPLKQADNPQVYRAVENVAIAAGLPMPKVYVIDDVSMNAFATGRSPKSASIALTKGIIARLEPLELEGVIAHEMAHIGNRDMRLNMLIITGLSIFAFAAELLRIRLFTTGGGRKQNQAQILIFAIIIALLIFNALVAPIIRLAISRTREYAADATGALITRNPLALASALRKITTDSRVEVLDKQPAMATACIADPKEHTPLALNGLTSTHPSTEKRIKRLMEMSGQE